MSANLLCCFCCLLWLFFPLSMGAQEEAPLVEPQTEEAIEAEEQLPEEEIFPIEKQESLVDRKEGRTSFFNRLHLTGEWGGVRSRLAERGVVFEIVYTGEVHANVSGGIRRQAEYLDNIDLVLAIDGEKLLGWKGATFLVYGLGNYGGDPSENVGDFQVTSNIEAPDTFKLYEIWWQQNFFQDMLSFKFGLYDVNTEFDVMETAGLFINSSQGMGAEFAQSGVNGPSIFPTTSLGLRALFQPTDSLYFQTAVLDGVPGDPDDPRGTHVILDRDDGLLLTGEMGVVLGKEENSFLWYGKYAFGGWYYTETFDDVLKVDALGNPVRRRGNWGFYLLAEQTIYQEEDKYQGLAIFARVGIADDKVNQVSLYTGGGLVYTGLIPFRDKDQLGLAIAVAHNGNDFETANDVDDEEVALELTYLVQLTPWLTLQPDLQYIFNPGTDPELDDAVVLALRFTTIF